MLIYFFILFYVAFQVAVSVLTEQSIHHHELLKEIGKRTRVVRIAFYVLLGIVPALGAFLPDCRMKYLCMSLGNIWLGFFLYYSLFLLVVFFVLLIVKNVKKKEEKKLYGHVFHICVVLALLVMVYGMIHAQDIKVKKYKVTVDKKVSFTKEMTIVLIADLHLSVNSYPGTTEKMVRKINELKPDAVVIAGDVFTSTFRGLSHPEKYSAALRGIQAKEGVYLVCGNHDVDENLFGGFSISPVSEAFRTTEMEQFFKDCGFTVLYDEVVELAGGEVVLAGRVDGEKAGDGTSDRKSAEELLKTIDKTKPVLVLEHEPLEFEELSANGADAVFCGHTHNGQVFPGNLIVPFFNENAYGHKVLYGIDTVVTAGTGYYGPPIRVGTDSEISVVNLSFR